MSTPEDWRRIAAENAKKPRFGLQHTLERLQQDDSEMTSVEMAGWTHVVPNLLGQSLLENRSLVTLSLQACRLGDDGVKQLCPSLEQGSLPLRYLNLSANGIGDEGATALGKAISHHRSLKEVILSWNGIGDVGARAMAATLETNVVLEALDLAGVLAGRGGGHSDVSLKTDRMDAIGHIGDGGCLALANALPNSNLRSLILSRQNLITETGIASLAGSLLQGTKLRSLELQRIPVDDDGAQALGGVLGACRLHTLDLALNQIGNRGAVSLARGIAANRSLEVVKLTQSSIALEGLAALAKAAATNTTVQQYELYGHEAGKAGSQHVWSIKPWLRRNRSLQVLLRENKRETFPLLLAHSATLSDKTRLFHVVREMSETIGTEALRRAP